MGHYALRTEDGSWLALVKTMAQVGKQSSGLLRWVFKLLWL